MNKQSRIKKIYLPLAAFVLSLVGLVATYFLTQINQDIRQQASGPDYGCHFGHSCPAGYSPASNCAPCDAGEVCCQEDDSACHSDSQCGDPLRWNCVDGDCIRAPVSSNCHHGHSCPAGYSPSNDCTPGCPGGQICCKENESACISDSDCGNPNDWRCIGGECLPFAGQCTEAESTTCTSSNPGCGGCRANPDEVWLHNGVCQAYCIPYCNNTTNQTCSFYCDPCGNDKTCPPNVTEPPPSITPPDRTPTPTEPDTNTPTPTEPIIGPQCHEVYLYKVKADGNLKGPLTGNMDSELSVGSRIKFRCTNSINNQGNLPQGYGYRFKIEAPCPNNPNQTCVTEGSEINPDNNGALSKIYTIKANGGHTAQCAVCDPDGNCDWEN